ncbi:MAG: glycosyltransferase family 2 protein [bacterium]
MEQQKQDSVQEADKALARRLLVAIPTLNEQAHIADCFTSLLGNNPALKYVQVVIADGGSTDKTRSIIEGLQKQYNNLHLIDNPKRLQSAGVNLIAKEGSKERDILIRCDAHSHYPEGYLLAVARALLQKKCDSLVVPMDAQGKTCFQKANGWIVDTPLGSGGSAHRGGTTSGYVDHGHHAGFIRKTFTGLGGYDESFSHNEDAEYDARLGRKGGKIWLDAKIRIRYQPRGDIAGLWRQYYGYGKGRARNLLKNHNNPRLRQIIPVINIFALLISVLLLPFYKFALAWPLIYLLSLSSASLWLALKKRSLCGLWGGVALGIMHLSWALGFIKGVWHHYRHGLTRVA